MTGSACWHQRSGHPLPGARRHPVESPPPVLPCEPVPVRILLAPMEGLLDHVLRDILTRIGGVDLCVAEFIRITDTLLPNRSFLRVVPELAHGSRTQAGTPVRVQLLGSDPVCIAENAAKLAQLNPWGIDLNFGCPAKTVNRHRGGAVLLNEPALLHDIVHAVRRAVPATIPVTAKMRLGYESPDRAMDCARALADGGAAEIAIHARTKTDGYKPPAYWEQITVIRQTLSIPVVANGEIWTREDAQRCRDISQCEDIMIGRGMVSNPALAKQIRGGDQDGIGWHDVLALFPDFWQLVSAKVEARHRGGRIKQWLMYLSRCYPQAQQLFDAIRRLNRPAEIELALFGRRITGDVPDLITPEPEHTDSHADELAFSAESAGANRDE